MHVAGTFTLDAASDGIDPVAEGVALRLGNPAHRPEAGLPQSDYSRTVIELVTGSDEGTTAMALIQRQEAPGTGERGPGGRSRAGRRRS